MYKEKPRASAISLRKTTNMWKKEKGLPISCKVFCISGNYPAVRKALLRRNWQENTDEESLQCDFKWTLKARVPIGLKDNQIFNHFSKNYELCAKSRLADHLKSHKKIFPRCYKIINQEIPLDFIDKFRAIFAISMLKNFVAGGEYPLEAIAACNAICNRWAFCLESRQREESNSFVLNLEWRLIKSTEANERNLLFKKMNSTRRTPEVEEVKENATTALKRLENVDPQFKMNGSKNVWIVKPAGKSRGRDISMTSSFEKIQEITNNKENWVVQKYIENPLIIENRKFDIRLWVLATQFDKLKLYVYNECYLRFSVEEWNINDLENIYIHLTNNCISKNSERFADSNIEGCMWHIDSFKQYLGETKWDNELFVKIKQIVKTCFSSIGSLGRHKNTFEIFGFDLMIDSDYQPWLLEVNSSPSMDYSTQITKTLVKNVLNDTVKVVIDHHLEHAKDIGNFRLIHQAK